MVPYREDLSESAVVAERQTTSQTRGSDYPHTEGTFPYSREQIAKDFAGVSEGEVHKMMVENAARLYGLATA